MKSAGNYQHLAMNNFNNLKGFASKIKEQARDAAKKLPSLDEMAAKDDYIHTEEFNVKGEKEKRGKNDEQSQIQTPQWSLIDKRIFQKEEVQSAATEMVPITSSMNGASRSRSQSPEVSTIPVKTDAPIQKAKPRSVMMSVVTDAMTARPASPEKEDDDNDDNSIVSDSSSDSDGEDPILSMLRQESRGDDDAKARKKKKPNKTKKQVKIQDEQQPKQHRFLTDMADAENQLETNNSQQANGEQAIRLSIPASPKELGSWMKNMASNQMNKLWKRPETTTQSSSAPPLAANRKSKQPARNPLQEEYHSQDSSNLLGDDELRQLAMLKQGNSGTVMGMLYEYRQFAFILFTLIFAGVVYYFKFGALEDGVL